MDLFKTKSLGATFFSEKNICGGAFTKAFVFEVVTAGADTFQLPIYNGGTYDFNVDWGDGNDDDITAWDDAAANHNYAGAGTYTVSITGTINGWRFNNGGDKTLIHDVSSWGPLLLGNNNGYFYGCSNLTVSATDILDLTGTTTFYYIFYLCNSLTDIPSINSWNMSSITDLTAAFGSTSFNQNINSWDMSSVTTIAYLFYSNAAFNQVLNSWDTESLVSTFFAFYGAISFDQDIGSWDVTALIVAGNMFQSITLSTANYDALLIGWEAQVEQPNVTFHGGGSKYSAGAAATARAALVANGWTITDGGQV